MLIVEEREITKECGVLISIHGTGKLWAGLWRSSRPLTTHFSKNDCSMKELYAQRSKNSEAVCFKNICKWITKNKTEKIKLEQYFNDFKVKNLGLIKWTLGNLYFILTKTVMSLSVGKVSLIWQDGQIRCEIRCKITR